MASQTDQRATDFEEVKKILAQQPRIQLVQTEGEPPDCYEIEYHVVGLVREADGNVRKNSRHVVLITLPFGYPHFPPAVKPLTPVFHPDIDPDAVRISSHWQKEPSLAKLIPHIGAMLCGATYSLDDPFNQEAADWYAEHAAELPFDSLEGAKSAVADADEFDLGLEDLDLTQTDSHEEQDAGLSFELEAPQAIHDISSLSAAEPPQASGGLALELEAKEEAAPVEENFDLGLDDSSATADDGLDLGLEIGEPEEAVPQDFGPKLEEIRTHVDRREMTIAARLLAELPTALPEAEPLRKKVMAAQAQCDQLLQEMKMLEDEDNFPEAQKVFEKLKKVAVDTPGLAEIGRRLQESQSMLDTFSLKEEKAEPPQVEQQTAGKKKKAAVPPPKPKDEKKETPAAEPAKEKREVIKTKTKIARSMLRREIPVAPFVAAAVAAALIVVAGLVYTRDSNMLLEAELNWQEAQTLVKQNEFSQADSKVQSALATLDSVLIPSGKKSRMRAEIDGLLAKEEYQRGLKGQAKYKNDYLPIDEVKKREELDKLTAKAEELRKAGKFGDAAAEYERAMNLAINSPAPLPANEAEQFKNRARQLRMKEAIEKAGRAESAGELADAASTYQQALEIAQETVDKNDKEAIRKKLNDVKFRHELDQSIKSYTGAQWDQTVAMLERAKKVLEENPDTATAERRQEVERLLTRSRLHKIMAEARQAYDGKNPAAAVSGYKKAVTMLNDPLLPFDQTDRNAVGSINRTIIMIEIGIELNAAVTAENQNELTDALRHYRAIQNLLATPGLIKDADTLALEQHVSGKVSSLSSTADMKRKMDWLNRNFKRIFAEAYSSARAENLKNPGMNLLRKLGGREIYKLFCSEGLYQLELIYQYDPAADQWLHYQNGQ